VTEPYAHSYRPLGDGLVATVVDLGLDPLAPEYRAALIEAWQHECGATLGDWSAAALGRQEVTVGKIERVSAIARHALGVTGTPVPDDMGGTRVHALAWELMLFAQRLAARGWPEADVYGWLTVTAGSPDCRVPSGMAHDVDLPVTLETVSRWPVRGLPEGVAAYCWAAGLSLREARRQATDGTLSEGPLRVLAGLGGFRLPAPGV
jgi:hypothetical protein